MSQKKFNVEFEEGTVVYFTFDEGTAYVVRGYEVRGNIIIYIVFSPEVGEVNAMENELSTERSIF